LILLWDIDQAPVAAAVAQRVLESFAERILLADRSHYVRISLGVALYPEGGRDAETLVRHADIAMYAAKDRGKNRYYFYNESLAFQAQRRMSLVA